MVLARFRERMSLVLSTAGRANLRHFHAETAACTRRKKLLTGGLRWYFCFCLGRGRCLTRRSARTKSKPSSPRPMHTPLHPTSSGRCGRCYSRRCCQQQRFSHAKVTRVLRRSPLSATCCFLPLRNSSTAVFDRHGVVHQPLFYVLCCCS